MPFLYLVKQSLMCFFSEKFYAHEIKGYFITLGPKEYWRHDFVRTWKTGFLIHTPAGSTRRSGRGRAPLTGVGGGHGGAAAKSEYVNFCSRESLSFYYLHLVSYCLEVVPWPFYSYSLLIFGEGQSFVMSNSLKGVVFFKIVYNLILYWLIILYILVS